MVETVEVKENPSLGGGDGGGKGKSDPELQIETVVLKVN